MELSRYVSILWRRAWLVLLATLLAASVSYWYTSQMPPVYSATTTLMVGQMLQKSNPQAGDFATSQQLAQTYAQMVRRQPLLQATVESLRLNTNWQALGLQVRAASPPNSQLLQITAQANDPATAVTIADELARQLIRTSPTAQQREEQQRQAFLAQQLQQLQGRITDAQAQIQTLQDRIPTQSSARDIQDTQNQIDALQQQVASWQATYASLLASQTGGANNLTVIDPAAASVVRVGPDLPLNVLAAAALGLALSIAAVALLEYLDDTLKTREAVAAEVGVPTLGLLPGRRNRRFEDQLLVQDDMSSSAAEAYRRLRTNLKFALLGHDQNAILVSSAIPDEGKTTAAGNLAISLARSGKRVILCDGDLRRPSVHRLFGVSNETGLTTLLLDESLPLESALLEGPVPGLKLLLCGSIPPNPAELLESAAMEQRVDQMRAAADIVVFDTPALLAVGDARLLGRSCDGVVLVVDGSRTRRDAVRRATASLEQVNLKILGVILNRVSEPGERYHSYYSTAAGTVRRKSHRHSLSGAWANLLGVHH